MSQTNKPVHKLEIKNKSPGNISTGANTEIFLDGLQLKGVTFLKVELKPRKITKVVIEMIADIDVNLDKSTIEQHVVSKYDKKDE